MRGVLHDALHGLLNTLKVVSFSKSTLPRASSQQNMNVS